MDINKPLVYPPKKIGVAHVVSFADCASAQQDDAVRAGEWVFSMLHGRATRPPSDLVRWVAEIGRCRSSSHQTSSSDLHASQPWRTFLDSEAHRQRMPSACSCRSGQVLRA